MSTIKEGNEIMRKSKIAKSIRRVYNVGKYESLEISVTYEEDVAWEKVQERQDKSQKISNLLLRDFELTRQAAFNNENIGNKSLPQKTNAMKNESVDELGLDSLD